MSMLNGNPEVLDYGRHRPFRKPFIRAAFIVLLPVLLISATYLVKPAAHLFGLARQRQRLLGECSTSHAPPSQVIFDELAGRTAIGSLKGAGTRARRIQLKFAEPESASDDGWRFTQDCWTNLQNADWAVVGRQPCVYGTRCTLVYDPTFGTGYMTQGYSHVSLWHPPRYLCFLHNRRSQSGTERLVAIEFDAGAFVWDSPTPFSVHVLRTAHTSGSLFLRSNLLREFNFVANSAEPLKLFAGQPDVIDPSHFTIRFMQGNTPGIIDGWLQPDDSVRMAIRSN
jgi:hypothetical protein